MGDYQMSLSREIEARLKDKCDKLGDAFIMDDIGRFYFSLSLSLSLSLSVYEIKIAHVCPHDMHIRDVFLGISGFCYTP
jgi:hypothetical protein